MKNSLIRFFTALMLLFLAASVTASATEIIIGTGKNIGEAPLSGTSTRTQMIVHAGQIGGAYRFTSLGLDVLKLPASTVSRFTIRMKHTSLSSYSAGAWESEGWTTVYQASETISALGWHMFIFNTAFDYNGTDNLMVDLSCYYGASGQCYYTVMPDYRTFNTFDGIGDPLTWSGSTPSGTTVAKLLNLKLRGDDILTPYFDPVGGFYTADQQVTIICNTPGATIHYTTNGVDPTEDDPTIESGASVSVVHPPMTLKARAWYQGAEPSAIHSERYDILTTSAPYFNPSSGGVAMHQDVLISCTTPNAVIHYTTSGIDPTEDDPAVVSGSFVQIVPPMTLKAKAWTTGMHPSATRSSAFTIGSVYMPGFSAPSGSYTSPINVKITCVVADAVIHYTTNGLDPTEYDPIIASGSNVIVDRSMTLKAKAWKADWLPSGVRTAIYTMSTNFVLTPVFTPGAGTYTGSVDVVVTCETPSSVIHYTTNLQSPTENDPIIASGATLHLDRSVSLKAKAWRIGSTPSVVRSAYYVIQVATPAFSPDGGDFTAPVDVIVTCSTPGAVIRYTINGNDPSENDPIVQSGSTVRLNGSSSYPTLKAKAWLPGCTSSFVKSASYSITLPTVATPTFSPGGGTYHSPRDVTIACETPGAVIHYTTNGLTPTESDPIIASGSAVRVDRAMVLAARAWMAEMTLSMVRAEFYALVPPLNISQLKAKWDTADAEGSGPVITAVFPDFFYMEADDGASGIRVEKAAHGLSVGMRADITGTVLTNLDGERYISAWAASGDGSGHIEPLVLRNSAIGGGDWQYGPMMGMGQRGVSEYYTTWTDPNTPVTALTAAQGLNNIGLLVWTTGHVTYSESGFFYIDDGSALDDGSGHKGIKVLGAVPVGEGEDPVGKYVKVTGISSCLKSGLDLFRLIRATGIGVVPGG